jgi:2-dehydro-3-deoxyphosphogluconate aldolase / (4S)-4-hydroxy-2-oxoglutarate aldolase
LVEITLTTPGACDLIEDLVAQAPEGVSVGAGTVLHPGQVADAVAAGAAWLVSPTTDADALAAATAAGVPLIPGAATPTEIAAAARHGAPVVKVFPASALGRGFLQAVAVVMPDVPLLASGGIRVPDVAAWLGAGAAAVAIGGELDAADSAGGEDAVAGVAAAAVAAADCTADRNDPRSAHDG